MATFWTRCTKINEIVTVICFTILHTCKNTGTWCIIYVLGTAEYMVFLMQYFFLSLEIYFLADHIIYGVLNLWKRNFSLLCIIQRSVFVWCFFKFHFPSLDLQKGLFFMKKKIKAWILFLNSRILRNPRGRQSSGRR